MMFYHADQRRKHGPNHQRRCVDYGRQKHINGIYVLRFNGELLVKRLQFTMSNTIKVISDNKAYDTEEINPEQLTGTDLEIIGRVVWSGQRM